MPYNPQIAYSGDRALFEGISQGKQRAFGMLQNYFDEQKKLNDNAAIADKFVKTNPDVLNKLGMHEEEFKSLGAKEKVASMGAYMQSQAAEAQRLKMDEMRRAVQNYQNLQGFNQDVAQAVNPPAAAAPATAGMMPGLMGMLNAAGQQPGAAQHLGPEAIMAYAARNNVLGDPNVDRILAAQERYAPASPSFIEDPRSGARFVQQRNTLMPSGFNVDKLQSKEEDLFDENGNKLGTKVWDGKKWVIKAAPKTISNELSPAVDPTTKKPIPGIYINPNTGHHLDYRSQIDKAIGGAGTAAPAAAVAPVKGQRVKQDGVIYEFDGKSYVPVPGQ